MSFRVPSFHGAMVFGTLSAEAASALELPPGWSPVLAGGHALGCLWLSDFHDSTVGPYRELTVTLLLAEEPLRLLWQGPYTPLVAQLRPDVVVCEHTLVLDNPAAIAYGRDLHGFDKHPGRLDFRREGGRFQFAVEMAGEEVVAGRFAERNAVLGPLVGLARVHGLLSTLSLLSAPFQRMAVITPPTLWVQRSELFFRGQVRLQEWGRNDALRFGEAPMGRLLTELDFRPTAVQRVLSGEGWMPLSAAVGAGRRHRAVAGAELVDERAHGGHDLGAAQDLAE